ncbi:hypothetical protein ACYATM_06020 [Lactobacillaceae bacterium Scapto_B20]
MQNKLKICIGASILAATGIVIQKEVHERIEKRIYQQIHQQFPRHQIYGTWLHPEYQLLATNYYLGGINVSNGDLITSYQFRADQRGHINELYKTGVQKVNRF